MGIFININNISNTKIESNSKELLATKTLETYKKLATIVSRRKNAT